MGDNGKLIAIRELLHGSTIKQAQAASGLNKYRIKLVWKGLRAKNQLPENCKCGRPCGHKGNCRQARGIQMTFKSPHSAVIESDPIPVNDVPKPYRVRFLNGVQVSLPTLDDLISFCTEIKCTGQ